MRRLKLYLDTSVISHLFHEDEPERQAVTKEFFREGLAGAVYEAFISPVVVDELSQTRDERRREMLLAVISEYRIPILDFDPDDQEVNRLAKLYVERGIIPATKPEDSLHVALAPTSEIDILVSWNYRHLSNVGKETRILAVNVEEGYTKPLRLITPLELSIK